MLNFSQKKAYFIAWRYFHCQIIIKTKMISWIKNINYNPKIHFFGLQTYACVNIQVPYFLEYVPPPNKAPVQNLTAAKLKCIKNKFVKN